MPCRRGQPVPVRPRRSGFGPDSTNCCGRFPSEHSLPGKKCNRGGQRPPATNAPANIPVVMIGRKA